MKHVFIFLFALNFLVPCTVSAQFVTEMEIGKDAYAFHGDIKGRIKTFQSDAEAVAVVRRLMDSMGLPLRFEVRAGAVPNASAILQKNGKRLIVYNVIFIENIKKKTGNYWSSISIMAHEIGHHLSFHLSSHIEDHIAELESDYFSGFILGKLGADLDQTLAAMRELGSPLPSKTHPKREDRLQSIALGWKNATANLSANPEAVKNIPDHPDDNINKKIEKFISEEHLLGKSEFTSQVDFFDKGLLSREVAIRETKKYYQKWPIRHYKLVPGTLDASAAGDNKFIVSFRYSFMVSDGNKEVNGYGNSILTLVSREGHFYVAAAKEVVQRK